VLCQLASETQPSLTFLSSGFHLSRWFSPALGWHVKLVGHSDWLSVIWTLVLRQGTSTPLVHAHAGRTPSHAPDGMITLSFCSVLSTAGDASSWAALYLGGDSASILSAGSKDLESSNHVRASVANREAKS
jgi:hypothetical protein